MMQTCESMKHDQIVFDTSDSRNCPLCALHFYVDSLEDQLKASKNIAQTELLEAVRRVVYNDDTGEERPIGSETAFDRSALKQAIAQAEAKP